MELAAAERPVRLLGVGAHAFPSCVWPGRGPPKSGAARLRFGQAPGSRERIAGRRRGVGLGAGGGRLRGLVDQRTHCRQPEAQACPRPEPRRPWRYPTAAAPRPGRSSADPRPHWCSSGRYRARGTGRSCTGARDPKAYRPRGRCGSARCCLARRYPARRCLGRWWPARRRGRGWQPARRRPARTNGTCAASGSPERDGLRPDGSGRTRAKPTPGVPGGGPSASSDGGFMRLWLQRRGRASAPNSGRSRAARERLASLKCPSGSGPEPDDRPDRAAGR